MILEEYLLERGWNESNRYKGRKTFQKNSNANFLDQDFRNIGKRKFLSLSDLNSRFLDFFDSKGYMQMPPTNVLEGGGETFFIGAGLQSFYQKFIKNRDDDTKFVLSQPSIRMSGVEKMDEKDGYSTSFVNVCTEQANVSLEDHVTNLENWFTFLSGAGIYVGNLKLIEDPEWSGGDHMSGSSLLIYYGGMQIGDAVFVDGKDPVAEFKISDIGFGLERICWAIRKTPTYFETIGPHFDLISRGLRATDAIRTLTLMSMSGTDSSNTGPGYRFKQMVKRYLSCSMDLEPGSLIENYFDFWSPLVPSSRSFKQTRKNITSNFHKHLILEVSTRLELQVSDTSNFNSFLENCEMNYPNKLNDIEIYLNERSSSANI